MHSLLEEYLNQLAQSLGPLPVARRNEEIKEIRQHLLNAVMLNRETGRAENEAVQIALDQFGLPQEVGNGIVWAWRRDQKLKRRDFWGATVCALLVPLAATWATNPLGATYWNWVVQHHHWNPAAYDAASPWLWGFSLFYETFHGVVGGVVSGAVFPRRAALGVSLAALIRGGLGVSQWIYVARPMPNSVQHNIFHFVDLVNFLALVVVYSGSLIMGAQVGSDWRKRRSQVART